MPAGPGESCLVTVFGDVHYYFSAPTSKPQHHRFSRGSYVYVFHNAAESRAKLEIANHAGTPEQDAFSGYFSNLSRLTYSYKQPTLFSFAIDGASIQGHEQWHLPSYNERNEQKYLYKIHTIDLYLWTEKDASTFLGHLKGVLPADKLDIRDAPPALDLPPEHRDSMSPVVQLLEKTAIGTHFPQRAESTTSAHSLPGPLTPATSIGAATASPPPPPAQAAPMAYNPAAPAAPEPIAHREKTPPPPEDGTGTGLGGYNPIPQTQYANAPSPFSSSNQHTPQQAYFSGPPPLQQQAPGMSFAGPPSQSTPPQQPSLVTSFAGPPSQSTPPQRAHSGSLPPPPPPPGSGPSPQQYNPSFAPPPLGQGHSQPTSPPPNQQNFNRQSSFGGPPIQTQYANYPQQQRAPSFGPGALASPGLPGTPGYTVPQQSQQPPTPSAPPGYSSPGLPPPQHSYPSQQQQQSFAYSNYSYSAQQPPTPGYNPHAGYAGDIHNQAYRPTEYEANNGYGGRPQLAAQRQNTSKTGQRLEGKVTQVEAGVGKFMKRLDKLCDYSKQGVEEAAAGVKDFGKQLISSQGQKVSKRILEIFRKCAATADELQRLLEHVRGAGKNLSKAKAIFRAMAERKAIEKLENTLKQQKKDLSDHILQDVWVRIDLQQTEQREAFEELRAHNSNVERWFSMLMEHQQELKVMTRTGFNAIEQTRRHDEFLRSLSFQEMRVRRENITDTEEGTFAWVFDKECGEWSDFGEWLSGNKPIYWISGKAGAGKLTLMARIAEDPRTKEGLTNWSRGCQLHLLSFFLWWARSRLQNSTAGLLRSLLHQICWGKPDVIEVVLKSVRNHVDDVPVSTGRQLKLAITAALAASSGARYCIFIDGLDEFVGDYDDVLKVILALRDLRNVKCCVSSRPEIKIMRKLAHFPRMQLHDLNYRDISEFVLQKLPDKKFSTISEYAAAKLRVSIAEKAEGVFLWAALVTAAVLRGAKAEDEEKMLFERIERAPQELNDLFHEMLNNVGELHRESLAFYLGCLELYKVAHPEDEWYTADTMMTSISVLTAARTDGKIGSYDSFVQLCQQTEAHIMHRSAGLLHIYNWEPYEDREGFQWGRRRNEFVSRYAGRDTNVAVQEHEAGHHSWRRHLPRRRCYESEKYPDVIHYEHRAIDWVHRSAYDFVFHSDRSSLLDHESACTVRVCERLLSGAVAYVAAAPSTTSSWGPMNSLTMRMVGFITRALGSTRHLAPSVESLILDDLHALLSEMDPAELADDDALRWLRLRLPVLNPRGTVPFWRRCVSPGGCWSYILSRIDTLIQEPSGNPFLAQSTAECMFWFTQETAETMLTIIARLLEALWQSSGALTGSSARDRCSGHFIDENWDSQIHKRHLSFMMPAKAVVTQGRLRFLERSSLAEAWFNCAEQHAMEKFCMSQVSEDREPASEEQWITAFSLSERDLAHTGMFFGILISNVPWPLRIEVSPRLWWELAQSFYGDEPAGQALVSKPLLCGHDIRVLCLFCDADPDSLDPRPHTKWRRLRRVVALQLQPSAASKLLALITQDKHESDRVRPHVVFKLHGKPGRSTTAVEPS
ncbi:hypothetical protein LTR37_004304 [Vermiconidia calcicola]|uniref:Uncharacterized protein n=1 Tax=Vermiconidia calcicola TaxID=1690605 RepID=A0ACC3NM17_9PEZI|nr:hypothetical protein LTR37_004304 [Vermiconidia calcicola]